MQEVQIEKLSQYIDVIEQLKDYYKNTGSQLTFLYRGHSKESYELLPGLFRRPAIAKNEKQILYSFIQEASSTVHIPTDHLVRWAEYAQHYGVPTRFLDWTKNPLVALYFACKSAYDVNGRVWILNVGNFNIKAFENIEEQSNITILEIVKELIEKDSNYDYPIQYTPFYVDPRMSAQSSYFMVWGSKHEPLEKLFCGDEYAMTLRDKTGELFEYLVNRQKQLLFCFTIPAAQKRPLLLELDTVGINEKTLFPGLDGIGRYVERKTQFIE